MITAVPSLSPVTFRPVESREIMSSLSIVHESGTAVPHLTISAAAPTCMLYEVVRRAKISPPATVVVAWGALVAAIIEVPPLTVTVAF